VRALTPLAIVSKCLASISEGTKDEYEKDLQSRNNITEHSTHDKDTSLHIHK